jgi:hypothetical protein
LVNPLIVSIRNAGCCVEEVDGASAQLGPGAIQTGGQKRGCGRRPQPQRVGNLKPLSTCPRPPVFWLLRLVLRTVDHVVPKLLATLFCGLFAFFALSLLSRF